ncbi:unnamed protein product [Allacma fusca]|uniref:Uncharacterized protein n=1 Tax=Allacma fusca TaxID=39272 RepID=A0A8J2PWF3_9HEXA|nr:unnamed protein product [Allacma fusca]
MCQGRVRAYLLNSILFFKSQPYNDSSIQLYYPLPVKSIGWYSNGRRINCFFFIPISWRRASHYCEGDTAQLINGASQLPQSPHE